MVRFGYWKTETELSDGFRQTPQVIVVSPADVFVLTQLLLHFARVVDDAKCILVTAVCVSVCVSVPRHMPTLLHRPRCNLGPGNCRGCPPVVHYWADLQSVHGFCCYDNIAPNAKCRQVLVLAVCLVADASYYMQQFGLMVTVLVVSAKLLYVVPVVTEMGDHSCVQLLHT